MSRLFVAEFRHGWQIECGLRSSARAAAVEPAVPGNRRREARGVVDRLARSLNERDQILVLHHLPDVIGDWSGSKLGAESQVRT